MHVWKLTAILSLAPSLALAWTIQLAWDPPEMGVPTGYSVERKRGLNDTWGALASRTGPNATVPTYTDTSELIPELPLCYRVRALSGNYKSGYSNELCFDSIPVDPTEPRNLTGTFVGSFIGTFTPEPVRAP